MPTFYAVLTEGSSQNRGSGESYVGRQFHMDVEAENRVQAFLEIYRRLAEDYLDITALRNEKQSYMLGFTAEKWDEISKQPIRLKVFDYPRGDVQIQGIQDRPYI